MTARAGVRALLAFILAAFVWLALPAFAFDEQQVVTAEASAQALTKQLRSLQDTFNTQPQTDEQLNQLRGALDKLRASIATDAASIEGPLSEVAAQVKQLGPLPDDGSQEAASIAQQRKELNAQLSRLTAVQKQFVLLNVETDQTESRISQAQRSNFLQRIFQSGRSVLDPRLWVETASSSSVLWQRIGERVLPDLRAADNRGLPPALLIFPIGVFLLWLVLFVAMPRLFARIGIVPGRADSVQPESALLRLWRVVWGMTKLFFIVLLTLTLFALSLDAAGILTTDLGALLDAISSTLSPALLSGGLVYLVAAPRHPERRLVAIDNQAARTLTIIVFVASLIYAFGEQVSTVAGTFNLPVSFAIGQSAFTALAMILLLGLGFVILRRQASADLASGGTPYFLAWFLRFLPVLWLLLAVAALALVFGFIALSYFIVGNLLDTSMLVILLGVIHAFADALAAAMLDPQSGPGRAIRRVSKWSEQAITRMVLVFRTVADALLVLTGVIALIALWTVVLFDFRSILPLFYQGVTVGNITISPGALAIALLTLSLGFFATKIVTNWLNTRVLSATQLDKGVQNSLTSVAGYSGYILASLLALSVAGVNFSNIALVAGALGVGIGLGLQSIVTNFVSGLILLAERPVRVGDWIVTKSGEGIVKKINVRSTEIESFDNSTVIVPNSMLVNDAVRNWTHRDTVGRFAVMVSMVHGVDVDEMSDELLKIARENPKVMRHPAPSVHLSNILPAALVFEVSGLANDVFEAGGIASDIRMEIVRRIPKKYLLVPQKGGEAAAT